MADIFLEYGTNTDGELIHISQVQRGRSALACPYCGVPLLARKGEKVAAHFAHDGPTCAAASRDSDEIALPAFDKFNLRLSGRMVEVIREFSEDPDSSSPHAKQLEKDGFLAYNDWKDWYSPTHKGKIVIGQLSLDLFNKFQEPLIHQRHNELEERVRYARDPKWRNKQMEAVSKRILEIIHGEDFDEFDAEYDKDHEVNKLKRRADELYSMSAPPAAQTAIIDLKLYRTQWRRILTNTLYFLEVNHTGGQLHKIGVTTRPVAERVSEIQAELLPLLGATTIKVINTWPHRGNVELYFKFRYVEQRAQVGNLTEYFKFKDLASVKRDLSRMKAKVLSEIEHGVLLSEKTFIEIEDEALEIEARRRAAIRAGMKRSAVRGESIGRPRRTSPETPEEVLSREYADRVMEQIELFPGASLRDLAQYAKVSVNTVRKVKDALATLGELNESGDPSSGVA